MSKRRLTESQVIDIRKRYAQGEKQVDLAKAFGVSQAAISKIVHDKARTEEARHCLDCSEPINLSRKRCAACQHKYKFVYWQQWYEANGKAVTTRRYRTQKCDWGGYVIDKHTNEKHGPHSYNHTRYLTSLWNKRGKAG